MVDGQVTPPLPAYHILYPHSLQTTVKSGKQSVHAELTTSMLTAPDCLLEARRSMQRGHSQGHSSSCAQPRGLWPTPPPLTLSHSISVHHSHSRSEQLELANKQGLSEGLCWFEAGIEVTGSDLE